MKDKPSQGLHLLPVGSYAIDRHWYRQVQAYMIENVALHLSTRVFQISVVVAEIKDETLGTGFLSQVGSHINMFRKKRGFN